MAVSSAIEPSAVARVVGIETRFINLREGIQFLPQQIAILGQGSTAVTYNTDKFQITSSVQAGKRYGFGSPIHLAARELLPQIGRGVGTIPVHVLPLEDDGSGVAASGSIEPEASSIPPASAGAYRVIISGFPSEDFVIDTDDTPTDVVNKMADAINAVLHMPVKATANTSASPVVVDLEAKWAGESSNDITVTMETPETDAVTFVVTAMSGGLVNPDVQAGLDKIGPDQWVTMVVNTLNSDDSDALDTLDQFGEARWGPLVRKPFVAFRGNTEVAVADATSTTSTRTTDRTNVQLAAPGSPNLPVTVAAAQVTPIAVLANSNPPHDYGSRRASSIVPGADNEQWDFSQRDQAVKAGSSTIELRDGEVSISDVVTAYSPEGEIPPAYRFVVDIVKLQQIIFNLDLIFNTPKWDGAPLIPDGQPTTNRDAKKPSDAKAAAAGMIESLGNNAIISAPDVAKEGLKAEIDSQNPKRLNLLVPVQISGNTNIRSIDLEWGFYFG